MSISQDGTWFVELAALADPAYPASTTPPTFTLQEVQGVPPKNHYDLLARPSRFRSPHFYFAMSLLPKSDK